MFTLLMTKYKADPINDSNGTVKIAEVLRPQRFFLGEYITVSYNPILSMLIRKTKIFFICWINIYDFIIPCHVGIICLAINI